jgi:hypothetical protein
LSKISGRLSINVPKQAYANNKNAFEIKRPGISRP